MNNNDGMKKVKVNERTIQTAIMREKILRGTSTDLAIPNSTLVLGHEADLITVSRTGFISEFEIKCSKADYQNDFNKERKHDTLKRLLENKKAGITSDTFRYRPDCY